MRIQFSDWCDSLNAVHLFVANITHDKYHLFTWTDERFVEEVENLKCLVSDLESELSELKADVAGLEKQVEHSKCTRTHVDTPHASQADTHANMNKSTPATNPFDPRLIIQGAVRFANQVAPQSGDFGLGDDLGNEKAIPPDTNGSRDGDDLVTSADVDVEANADVVDELDPADDMVSSPRLSQLRHATEDNANKRTAQMGPPPEHGVQRTPSTCVVNNPQTPEPVAYVNSNLDNVQTNLVFPKPTFSLGLTQEERHVSNVDESLEAAAPISLADNEEPFQPHMKITHLTNHANNVNVDPIFFAAVLSMYSQCLDSNGLFAFLRQSSHLTAKVVDVLIHHTRSLVQAHSQDHQPNSLVFLDTKMDGMINKEIHHISEMFPYLLRRAAKQFFSKNLKTLSIDRPRIVPQNHNNFDSGMTSILLMQVHAVAGLDVCKCITPDVLDVKS
ncbi:hypothetical protein F2Q69_00062534 [Brassica cretica]|uniref:Ubiquitin-like protease family profile domain-containing protein n=1 Tax=Brassica cretica TaxID=69181 RepID=A0A8S9RD66_BRACR|nr:hypothetical protein F2Q69_00062534 [Brassica cretica]